MSEIFNKLTPDQSERLAMLAEEAGEIVQAVTKILRHGYASQHPAFLDTDKSNRKDLEREIGDLWGIVVQMSNRGDISTSRIREFADEKWLNALKYTHHQDFTP